MFNKKECSSCGKKIKKDYEFCPFCGNTIIGKQQNLGMLGNDDRINDFENLTQNIFQGFGGGILNKMLNNTMKMLEKEMQKEIKMQQKQPKTNMQLFINGKKIEVPNMQQPKPVQKIKQQIKSTHFSSSGQEKFASLKQKEPSTTIKRLGDTILYEISLPNVKSIKEISIVKLENSVEIKAISKNTAYFKSIPINLDLTEYEFNNEKLVLEFSE
ncbi:MAG: zinc ribbon domain-containing protein [Nanoarchaeota archaeon]